jgi:UDP-N-acetylmuramyl pentapeptide phosphotransferase/UDP-N-acetylglucosamine-1-phosphate transferase
LTDAITAIFVTLILAAGWFYLTQSRTVELLKPMESPRRNKTRRKARRLGAGSMIVLGVSWFWAMWEMKGEPISQPKFALALLLVGLSLITIVLTTMVDVYLTFRLRKGKGPPQS